jgi:hypothetical protein
MTTEQMAEAAMKRLREWINRSCAQHLRAMREGKGKTMQNPHNLAPARAFP